MRIDKVLVEQGLFPSREKAVYAIEREQVFADGKMVTKPSYIVKDVNSIHIGTDICPYVSRGGYKLQHALEQFRVECNNKIVLDIGASTGGFTDCALQYGAKKVYALDVGKEQLDTTLKNRSDIIVLEEMNILNYDIPNDVSLIVMDVSFISILKILPYLFSHTKEEVELIVLIKPQFEAGKMRIKNGVIQDPKLHKKILERTLADLSLLGFCLKGLTGSPQRGKTGNIEFLAHLTKRGTSIPVQLDEVIKEAYQK